MSKNTTAGEWWRSPSIDWTLKESQKMVKLLAAAYSEEDEIVYVAKRAGIDRAHIDVSGAPRQVWLKLLETAAKADRLNSLLEEVLDDDSRAAYHSKIEALMGARRAGVPRFAGGIAQVASSMWLWPSILLIVVGTAYLFWPGFVLLQRVSSPPLAGRLTAVDNPNATKSFKVPAGAPEMVVAIGSGWRLEREYELWLEGYLRYFVTVRKRRKVVIDVERQLILSPSVLLRPAVDGLRSLDDGGRLCVWERRLDQRIPVARIESQSQSLLLGVDRQITPRLTENWRQFLTRRVADGETSEQIMSEWNDPVKFMPASPLRPGIQLEAEIHSAAGYLVERAPPFTLDDTAFVDKLMEAVFTDQNSPQPDCLLLPTVDSGGAP